MISYYFGGEEQLCVAVLEQAYAAIREAEQQIDVEHLDPAAAIRRLAELTFDHHEGYPDFIRLVSIENIHRAEHVSRSERLTTLNTPAIELIARILDRGTPSARSSIATSPAQRCAPISDMLGDMIVGYLTSS